MALLGAGLLPLQGRQLEGSGAFEVVLGVGGGLFFAVFDVVDRFGGRDPPLGPDVVDGSLHTLSVVLGKQAQVFAADFHFRPDTFIEHSGAPTLKTYSTSARSSGP